MRKKGSLKRLIIILFGLILLALGLLILTKKEKPFDFDDNGKNDISLITDQKAFVFLNTKEGFIPALYYLSGSSWELFSRSEDFLTVEEREEGLKVTSAVFKDAGKNLLGNEIWASSEIQDSRGNKFEITIKVKKEKLLSNTVFAGHLQIKNLGPGNSPKMTASLNFPLMMDAEKAYYFSPGIFYGDNNPVPFAAEEMRIPNLGRMKKEGMYTFLANRPMLPLIASWERDRMVMMVTEESSTIGETPVRNSLGWRIKEDRPELVTWTHGYIFRRYAGPGDWELVDKDTDSQNGLLKGETIKKKFYLTFTKGDLKTVFSSFRLFREYFRQNLPQTVYEDMASSFKTKKESLPDFYNHEMGYFSQVAGHKENVVSAWVGGVPAGYGLLRIGEFLGDDDLKQKSVRFLDFLSQDSLAPSGFSYPIFGSNRWSINGWWVGPYLQGIPTRMASESTFYFLKAYLHELEKGVRHELWLKVALSNLEAVVLVWEKSHDFGYSYQEFRPQLEEAGSSAGILWVGALSLGYQVTGQEKYLEIAEEAAKVYAQRFLEKGTFYGCELDQGFSPDASCAAHAFTAYLILFEATKKDIYLDYAKQAADIYSTFVFGYNLPFSPSSWAGKKGWTSLGTSTSGARNNHLTFAGWPGFTYYLVKLYNLSGDVYYLHLASDQYRASLEGYAQSDSEFVGIPGMGKVGRGYGFDWLLHSDWGGERVWFGGIMHAGMLHQIYIPGANWPDTEEDFGDLGIMEGK